MGTKQHKCRISQHLSLYKLILLCKVPGRLSIYLKLQDKKPHHIAMSCLSYQPASGTYHHHDYLTILYQIRWAEKKNIKTPLHTMTRWWFQPIWKIFVKMGSSSPIFGLKIKTYLKPPTRWKPHLHLASSKTSSPTTFQLHCAELFVELPASASVKETRQAAEFGSCSQPISMGGIYYTVISPCKYRYTSPRDPIWVIRVKKIEKKLSL